VEIHAKDPAGDDLKVRVAAADLVVVHRQVHADVASDQGKGLVQHLVDGLRAPLMLDVQLQRSGGTACLQEQFHRWLTHRIKSRPEKGLWRRSRLPPRSGPR
jgi:hypothetical protein